MIRSLALCHQCDLALALQQAVIHIGTEQGIVSNASIQYWSEAHKE